MISVGIARLLPPRSLPPWRSVHNQNAASVAPSPPCGLSAWSGVSKVFSREHRSTEASSVVAWRRRWVAFWWRTSLDGGKPRRGGKSPRGSLSSCHSTQGRWRPESGESALLSAIASGPVARVRTELVQVAPGVATRGSHRPVLAQLTHTVPPVMDSRCVAPGGNHKHPHRCYSLAFR